MDDVRTDEKPEEDERQTTQVGRAEQTAAGSAAIRAALGLDTPTSPPASTPDSKGRLPMRNHIRLACTFAALAAVLLAVLAGPAGATTPISKSQRELVIVSTDLSQGGAVERALYDLVEMGGVGLGIGALGPRYNTVYLLSGAAATQTNFVSRLGESTAKQGVRAVDVIFMTHGLSDTIVFTTGGSVTAASLRDRIVHSLSASQRAKLRMLFSTACFGASHRSAWRDAGFKMVSGSRKVYADSAASYPVFLGTWTVGGSFSTAIAGANAAGTTSGWDAVASLWAAAHGYWWAGEVDSFRLTSGSTSLTINTMP